ncbi:uncharacterized protein METZ01_LOCUS517521, partial [marine metagenome]
LGKYPLVAYPIAAAKLSTRIEQVVVSTDSSEIADIAVSFGADVPFLRPTEISQDDSPDIDFFRHYVSFLQGQKVDVPEYLVHLRPTTPLRDIAIIDKGIDFLLSRPEATSMRSVYPSSFSPYKVFKLEDSFLKGFFSGGSTPEYYNLPRQAFPQTYIPNGYVDIIKTKTLDTGVLHGDKLLGHIVDKVPDIDDEEDFFYAEKCLDDARFSTLLSNMELLFN